MSVSIKVLARTIVAAHNAGDTARVTAGQATHKAMAAGFKQADIVKATGLSKGTVSKYALIGDALALNPTASTADKRAIAATAFGGDNAGDRAAMVQAVKDEDSAGVVKAVHADKPEGHKAGRKGSNKAVTVNLSQMTTDALLALVGDALEQAVKRDDAPAYAEKFTALAKSLTTLAKSISAMPVA